MLIQDTIDQSRSQLIQRATTRLRRRLLEENLQDLMRQLVHVQASLETIRVDTAATIANVNDMPEDATEEGIQKMNRQMDVLEKRLQSHQFNLVHFIPPSPPSSVSFHSPSTRATSVVSDMSDRKETHLPNDQQKRKERRKRVRNQKRRYQESVASYPSEECSDCTPVDDWHQRVLCTAGDEEEQDDPFYDLAGKRSFRAGSFCGSVYDESQESQTPSQHNLVEFAWRRRQRRKDLSRRASIQDDLALSVSQHHPLSPIQPEENESRDLWALQLHYINSTLYSERNLLDEAMSFMENVEGDDGGFREDLYLLLKNPDLCCRPFSEIQTTMHELRQQEGYLIRPVHSLLYKVTLSTLQWCRFLSVLSAAVVISVLKGPEDLCSPISR
ncbi:unnamed protein product [Rhizopus stolonifer]